MSLTLVTAPTTEPVTLNELKAHARIDFSEDDAYLQKCIVAARKWIEGQTKRAVISQTWDYTIDYDWPYYDGYHRIVLPMKPVQAISASSPEVFSITYVDGNGVSQTLAQSQYTLAKNGYVVPAYNVEWPEVRCVPDAITVRFVAGASSADEDMKQAVMILATHYYEMRETASGAPRAVEALISPYRRATF